MIAVAYCHPLVPPEWIAAHGLQPRWLQPERSPAAARSAARGACACAGAVADMAVQGLDAAALVLTTVCDQMRYAAAAIERHGRQPVFLLHVPATWQTAVARQMHLEELRRLGRFLVELGGRSPSAEELVCRMQAFAAARSALLAARDGLSPRQFAEDLLRLRSADLRSDEGMTSVFPVPGGMPSRGAAAGRHVGDGAEHAHPVAAKMERPVSESVRTPQTPPAQGTRGAVPLAIVGGPLVEKDFDLFDLVDRLGGRVALDATEGGMRLLPAAFDPQRMADEPLAELARAYFEATPDVFRRPNDALFDWLGRQMAAQGVRGLLFRRYVWCDLWHAELCRFRQWSPVPVLEIDVHHDDQSVPPRIAGRVEAFLEMLR
jgi:benzoyl-CoA reductase/2-hydroxyglutaryl-CoA dehydratase subunit BcrC/BadD/HgdB